MKHLLTCILLLLTSFVISKTQIGNESSSISTTVKDDFFLFLKNAFYNRNLYTATTTKSVSQTTKKSVVDKLKTEESPNKLIDINKTESSINSAESDLIWPHDVVHQIYESILFRKDSLDFFNHNVNEPIMITSTEYPETSTISLNKDEELICADGECVTKIFTKFKNGKKRKEKYGRRRYRSTSSESVNSVSHFTTIALTGVTPAEDWLTRTQRFAHFTEATENEIISKINNSPNGLSNSTMGINEATENEIISTNVNNFPNELSNSTMEINEAIENEIITKVVNNFPSELSNSTMGIYDSQIFSSKNISSNDVEVTSVSPTTQIERSNNTNKSEVHNESLSTEKLSETTLTPNGELTEANSIKYDKILLIDNVTTIDLIVKTTENDFTVFTSSQKENPVESVSTLTSNFTNEKLFNNTHNSEDSTSTLTTTTPTITSSKTTDKVRTTRSVLQIFSPRLAKIVTTNQPTTESITTTNATKACIEEDIEPVPEVNIVAMAKSQMVVSWKEPNLQDKYQCLPLRKTYYIKWSIAYNDEFIFDQVNATTFSFYANLFHQKYNVCVSISYLLASGEESIEKAMNSSEVCNISAESSPGISSFPNITKIESTSSNISVSFEYPETPNGNISYFQFQYCEISECNLTILNTSVLLAEITNLKACTNYLVIIQAINVDYDHSIIPGNETSINITTSDEEPQEISNIRTEMSSNWIKISWDEVNTTCEINYTIQMKAVSNCNFDSITNTTQETEIIFEDLKPYTIYNFTITASTKKGTTWTSFLNSTTNSSPDHINLIDYYCSSQACNISWIIPRSLTGPTTFIFEIFEVNGNKIGPSCNTTFEENDTCVDRQETCVFNFLQPYTKYFLHMLTTVPDNIPRNSSINLTTKAEAPSAPRYFMVDCTSTEWNGIATWTKPEKLNGDLEKFILNYIGIRPNKSKHIVNISVPPNSNDENYKMSVILKPEFKYTFMIQAKSREVENLGPISDFHCVKNTLKPPKTSVTFVPKNITTNSATIILRKSDFLDDNGEILNYSLILYEKSASIGYKRHLSCRQYFEFWHKYKDAPQIHPYRTSPDNWNPFLNNGNDEMCCNVISEIAECVIGCNKNCYQSVGPCNGPLRSSVNYEFFIQFYNKAGCADSPVMSFSTKIESEDLQIKSSDSALAVILVIFALAIVLGFFAYYKRQDIKTWFRARLIHNNPLHTDQFSDDSVLENKLNSRPVKIADFFSHYTDMSRDSSLKFSQEYEELKAVSPMFTMSAAQLNENRCKNRWINVLPFDHSRVKLLPISDDITTDYINACYIPGYNSQREYIATQGPLPGTKDDFWRMVWEQSSQMIIMVTQCVERGKVKCETYWPEDREIHYYADIAVRLRSESVLSHFTIRIFDLNLGTKSLEVKQMHFTKWPDFGCPENTDLLINFIQAVREHTPHNFVGPFVVHCSAGVGRTGTYIAVDRLLQHIRHNSFVDIYGLVLEMRQHRVNMVQTEDQYVYIHSCLRDILAGSIEEECEPLCANVSLGKQSCESTL